MYTRVYTLVYSRVYNSVHACTQLRSKYVPCGVLVWSSLGAKFGYPRDTTKALYRMWNNPPKEPKSRAYWVRSYVCSMISGEIAWLVERAYVWWYGR